MTRLGPMPQENVIDLFLSRIESVSSFSACWIWSGKPNENGYGIFGGNGYSRRGSSKRAHRRAYELAVGPIPDGLTIDHLCRRRLCVNPLHLEPVTLEENIRRARAAGAKTHCKRGHELTGANVHFRRDGRGRECQTCKSAGREASKRRSLSVQDQGRT